MENKKEISISTKHIRNLFLSLLLGFLTLFIIEHKGKVSFMSGGTPISESIWEVSYPPSGPVAYIDFTTPFDTKFRLSNKKPNGETWTNKELYFKSDWGNYENKVQIYFQATIKDYQYGLALSLFYFLLFLFFTKFKFKLKSSK